MSHSPLYPVSPYIFVFVHHQGAEPLFFLDYFACGKLDKDVAADVVKGIAAGCVDVSCLMYLLVLFVKESVSAAI